MKDTKMIKAVCRKTGRWYGLEIEQFGGVWKVVNMIDLSDAEAAVISSEVKQPSFETNDNLLACNKCGKRKVGGCGCAKRSARCSADMKYRFGCVYCDELEIDYSCAKKSSGRSEGEEITLEQGQKIRITFSNTEWEKYDNVRFHETDRFIEVPEHVIATGENIEFHGYHVSEMDEGVKYSISPNDDFEIECDVDTSKIQPHPGGHLIISMGIITAELNRQGGVFYLAGKRAAKVGATFSMKLSLKDGGRYTVEINGTTVGTEFKRSWRKVDIVFGFVHFHHRCEKLSHAYIANIRMTQTGG